MRSVGYLNPTVRRTELSIAAAVDWALVWRWSEASCSFMAVKWRRRARGAVAVQRSQLSCLSIAQNLHRSLQSDITILRGSLREFLLSKIIHRRPKTLHGYCR